MKASRGCRGFVGPVPQPLLIRRAYSVVCGGLYQKPQIGRNTRSFSCALSTSMLWLSYADADAIYAEHSPSMTTGANSATSAEVDEIGRHGVLRRSVARDRASSAARARRRRDEEVGRRLAVVLLARVELDQPVDRLRGCGAPESSPPAARTSRRRSSAPPPTMTKYCGTAREPTRRTLPWNPIVAM